MARLFSPLVWLVIGALALLVPTLLRRVRRPTAQDESGTRPAAGPSTASFGEPHESEAAQAPEATAEQARVVAEPAGALDEPTEVPAGPAEVPTWPAGVLAEPAKVPVAPVDEPVVPVDEPAAPVDETAAQADEPAASSDSPSESVVPPSAASELAERRVKRLQLWVEACALAILLIVALGMRVNDLEGPRSSFPDLFDEGIRSEQLLLMSHGYRPFREIYAAQGLLLLDLLYPFYTLFGGTLGAIRLGVGLLSVVGLAGAWWSVRPLGGPVGGLAAAILLTTAPAFLESSRLALAEVPSLVPCLWALGCALRWHLGGRDRWLYAAAILATLGVLIKPMAISIAVPLGLLLLLRPELRPRQVLIALALVAAVTGLSVLIMGPADVYQQIVQYRIGARQGATWDPRRNFKQVLTEPFHEQPGLWILGGAAALLLLARSWRTGLGLAAWPVAAIGLLYVYFPLHPKHLVYLYPPLAALGGAGLGRAAWLAWRDGPVGRTARLLTVGLALVLAALPLSALPNSFDDPGRDEEADDVDLHVFDDSAARSLQLLSGPDDYILTDHPYVAALARRLVPPNLVDPSRGRTRAGVLTDREAIDSAERFDAQVVLIWADRLRRLPAVPGWLQDNFVLSHIFGTRNVKNARGAKDRAIYLRKDVDFAAARAALEGALQVREPVDFEDKLRLLGASLSTTDLATREQMTVTVGWEAVSPMTVDYHVTLQLVGPGDDLRDEQEHDLEGSVKGTSTWEPGRWMFRTFMIQPDKNSPAGDYDLKIAVVDPKTGKGLRPTLAPGGSAFKTDPQRSVTVATIHLR